MVFGRQILFKITYTRKVDFNQDISDLATDHSINSLEQNLNTSVPDPLLYTSQKKRQE